MGFRSYFWLFQAFFCLDLYFQSFAPASFGVSSYSIHIIIAISAAVYYNRTIISDRSYCIMKIKQKTLPYETVAALPKAPHYKPIKPSRLLGTVVRVLAIFDQIKTKFTYTEHRMEKLGKEPCLNLKNHSCFLDLILANKLFLSAPF